MPAIVAPRNTSSAARRSFGVSSRASVSESRDPMADAEEVPRLATLARDDTSIFPRASIRLQLAHRARLVAAALEDAGEVEVRVGVQRIDLNGALIRGDRVIRAAEVFERDAEVERGDRM